MERKKLDPHGSLHKDGRSHHKSFNHESYFLRRVRSQTLISKVIWSPGLRGSYCIRRANAPLVEGLQ